jgi:hypothetical protein
VIDYPELAYLAYAKSTGGKTFDGRDMPTWDALPERIREAWRAAALAIEQAIRGTGGAA